MNISIALQIISYIVQNRKEISDLILQVQELFAGAPGEEKASAVRTSIGVMLGIADKIEEAWPVVAPIFNLFVAKVKSAA